MTSTIPTWEYEHRDDLTCLYCGDSRTVLVRLGSTIGACEACGVHAYWLWHNLKGEGRPTGDVPKVSSVRVLVMRPRRLASGEFGPAVSPHSYEVATVVSDSGEPDLPSAAVSGGDEVAAVISALAATGISSWPQFVEPLYAAHTPRGTFARVYLAAVYAVRNDDAKWRAWPPWEHAPSMQGLYLALRDVLPLRLAVKSPFGSLFVPLRRGAVEYAETLRTIKSGKPDVDTSMMEYLRKSMTEDERAVSKILSDAAEIATERAAETKEEAAPAGENFPAPPPDLEVGGDEVPFDNPSNSELIEDDEVE